MSMQRQVRQAGPDRVPGRPRPRPSALALAAACLWATAGAAQDQVRDYTEPILTLDTGGHSGAVRSLLFAEVDGRARLLSGGYDKVIHEWDLSPSPPTRSGTIRPPKWRGLRGWIYAAALSPEPAPDGHRILAVGGVGVLANAGTIALFRYPGQAGFPADFIGFLHEDTPGDGEVTGHKNTVMCLDFDPGGRYLASGGLDHRVLIWDLSTFKVQVDPDRQGNLTDEQRPRPIAVLEHGGHVNALKFSPDGRRLVTGTGNITGRQAAEGVLRLFDTADPEHPGLVLERQPRRLADGADADPLGRAILSLDLSADGSLLAIAREDAEVSLYDLDGLRHRDTVRDVVDGKATGYGAAEAVAFSNDPDAPPLLATSFRLDRLTRETLSRRPGVECEVHVRTVPDLRKRLTLKASNLVYAVAFAPDDTRLAFAGGDRQAIFLKDLDLAALRAPAPDGAEAPIAEPELKFQGTGASVWDIGFRTGGGTVLAYSFGRTAPEQAAPVYYGFDLVGRRPTEFIDGDQVRRAILAADGWSVVPRTPHLLELVGPGARHAIVLDETLDRRWWAYSFLPPDGDGGPGKLALAVACETGVAIYDVASGRRTRFLAGHEGPVYAVAPSPDGRWLATGSADQTARLWPLAGCDEPAPIGATFEPAEGGRYRVAAVEPRSHAEAAGLEVGQEIQAAAIGTEFFAVEDYDRTLPIPEGPKPLSAFFDRLPEIPAGTPIQFAMVGQDGGEPPVFGTTRRDSPALTFFPAIDGQWVLWTPQGYYDTSIEGDERHLGWHLNRSSPLDPKPTDFVEMKVFEERFRLPGVLDRLIATADVGQALALARAEPPDPDEPDKPSADVVKDDTPPPVSGELDLGGGRTVPAPYRGPSALGSGLGAGLLDVPFGTQPTLTARAEAAPGDSIARMALKIGSRTLDSGVIDPPRPRVEQTFAGLQGLGIQVATIEVTNQAGLTRRQHVALDFGAGEPGPERAGSLRVLTLGVDRFPGLDIAPIDRAGRDAEALADFFSRFAVGPTGVAFRPAEVKATTYAGDGVSAEAFRAELEALRVERRARVDGGADAAGDLIVLAIETHLLTFESGTVLLAPDSKFGRPPAPAIEADALTTLLGELAGYGATVLVVLDVVHDPEGDWTSRQTDWIRSLREAGVIAVVASQDDRPSRTAGALRALARGVVESVAGQEGTMTLGRFRDRLLEVVPSLTRRQQTPFVSVPPERADALAKPLLDPGAAPRP